MKVHLIRRATIVEFCLNNAQSRIAFDSWQLQLKYANWTQPSHMQMTFPSTDLFGNGTYRAVFDIGGNKYRMIVKYAFGLKQVHLFICWIGTHSAYSKLCTMNLQYTIHLYN